MHEELKELIKRLRNCVSDTVEDCAGCPYQGGYKGTYCMNGLVSEAADVIEGLSKKESTTTRTIKRGRWRTSKYDAFNVRCSECGHVSGNFWNFCPNCGADMRESPKEKA